MSRKFAPIIGILVLTLSACASPVVQEKTLDNGLKVVVRQDTRAPVVVSQVWYKVGSSDEPKGLTGISHVLEHMMFKGTQRLAPGEFSRIIAANGGRENAFTGKDYTAYFQQLEKSRLSISFDLEADRMHNLVLKEEEFKKEREVVIEERRLRTEDNPQGLAYEKFMATAYQKHHYKNPIIGWMDDLQNLKLSDLREWYERWYTPNNATLVVVGDVQPAEVFAQAEKYFGSIPSRPVRPIKVPEEPQQKQTRSSSIAVPAQLPYLLMGYHVPVLHGEGKDWEPYALSVLAGVLDGGASARFSSELVRGQQIAAQAGAGYSANSRYPTLFLFYGTPSKGKTVGELEQAIHQQVQRAQKEHIDIDELARVKAQVVAADVYGRDSVFYQAMRIGTLETVGLDHRLLNGYVERIKAVTPEQVQAVAKKYLIDSNLTKTMVDPLPMKSKRQRRSASTGGRHGR